MFNLPILRFRRLRIIIIFLAFVQRSRAVKVRKLPQKSREAFLLGRPVHLGELRSIIQWSVWHQPVHEREESKESETLKECFRYLNLTSRSFAAVIQELHPELLIPVTLFYLQRKARRAGLLLTRRLTLARFVSQIDLGGMLLLCGSFALILLPIDLASSTTSRWGTPWTPALIVVGVVLLACLYPYERLVARHPIVPPKYFTNRTIFIAFGLGCLDNIGFSATHTYLYAWSLVAHNLTPQTALYLAYVNGTTQCLTGILVGLVMYKTREYKWLGVAGAVIRMIG